MSYPKHLDGYPVAFLEILDKAFDSVKPVTVAFRDDKEAAKTRFKMYRFFDVLEKEGPEEYRDGTRPLRAVEIALKGNKLIFQHRDRKSDVKAIQKALQEEPEAPSDA